MKFSIPFLSLLLVAATLFTSCEKDNLNEGSTDALLVLTDMNSDEVADQLILSDPGDFSDAKRRFSGEARHAFHGDCFSILFPYEIELPDGTLATVSDTGELRTIIRDWAQANPDRLNPRVKPSFVYPLTVQLYDGSIVDFASKRELVMQLKECRPDAFRCAQVVFPIELQLGDELVTVESVPELRQAIRTYLVNNPGGDRPSIVFPIAVELSNGNIVEVESYGELRRIRAYCADNAREKCVEFVYPVTATTDSGRTITIENAWQMRRVFSRARVVAYTGLSLDFPLDVIVDGETMTLQSIDELMQLRRACAGEEGDGPCFRLNFPIDVETARGGTITVETRHGFERALFNRFFTVQWPVTAEKEGSTITLNSAREYAQLVASCR